MSIKVMTAIWDDCPCEGTELLMMLAIADHANDEGMAYPGVKSLQKKTRLKTKRGAQLVLARLESIGELRREVGKGRYGTNLYWLDRYAVGVIGESRGDEGPITGGVIGESRGGVIGGTPKPSTRIIIESSSNKGAIAPAAAERPKKAGHPNEWRRLNDAFLKSFGLPDDLGNIKMASKVVKMMSFHNVPPAGADVVWEAFADDNADLVQRGILLPHNAHERIGIWLMRNWDPTLAEQAAHEVAA